MNDLSGLNWSTSAANTQSTTYRNNDRFSSLRPTPSSTSRQPSPLSSAGRPTPLPQVQARPASSDPFASLGSSGKKAELSLQEKQKQLLAEKRREALGQTNGSHDPYKASDASFWEGFGSGRNTPAQAASATPAITSTGQSAEDEDDILAAFNASAPVDSSSHFPPPRSRNGVSSTSSSRPASTKPSQPMTTPQQPSSQARAQSPFEAEDDDPFGLGQMSQPKPRSRHQETPQDDEDVLGLLGKPVEDVPRPHFSHPVERREEHGALSSGMDDPRDKAIAELVDMGFDPERSRMALDQTGDGSDVQAAVGWLLTTAHEEARSRSRAQNGEASMRQPPEGQRHDRRQGPERSSSRGPAWLQQPGGPERADSRSPATVEKDVAQYASQFGTQVWKSANTLWKTGKKNVQKAVADFQQDDDGSKPRWMQEAETREREERGGRVNGKAKQQQEVTDEAAMLEPGSAPLRRPDSRKTREPEAQPETARRRPVQETSTARPVSRPTQKLSRQAVEEESMQAYVSPARRKKATPTPAPPSQPTNHQPRPAYSQPTETFDIFSDTPVTSAPKSATSSAPLANGTSSTLKPARPIPVRPKAAFRSVPQTSPTALQTSTKHRQAGTASYKIGDYAAATSSYLAALQPLPPTHPLTILLHANLALTHLKTGDAKAAVTSANTALDIIGPTRGEGESIDLGPSEGSKELKDLFAKSLTRKAEALEHLEKWSDAATTWREAIAARVGGAVAMRGRERCEKASSSSPSTAGSGPSTNGTTRPQSRQAPQKPPAARPKLSVTQDTAAQPPSEAITRLRAANAAAASASDEAFALNDSVTARIEGWKAGKEGNLRALLASLDTVLWAGANWTKVGMGDLVLPGRCKVVYMRAIGRCHPDKIPQDATVEQKMVSASVFATLNEAWDKFKRDNGMG